MIKSSKILHNINGIVNIPADKSISHRSIIIPSIANGITEVHNIQIGDGDVLRDWDIPVFMKFPRWYTCPAIRTPNLRVDFEISLVVTFEGRTQVSQIIPIHLYRNSKRVMG